MGLRTMDDDKEIEKVVCFPCNYDCKPCGGCVLTKVFLAENSQKFHEIFNNSFNNDLDLLKARVGRIPPQLRELWVSRKPLPKPKPVPNDPFFKQLKHGRPCFPCWVVEPNFKCCVHCPFTDQFDKNNIEDFEVLLLSHGGDLSSLKAEFMPFFKPDVDFDEDMRMRCQLKLSSLWNEAAEKVSAGKCRAVEKGKATEEAAGKSKAVEKAAEEGKATEEAAGKSKAVGKATEEAAGKRKAVGKAAEEGEAAEKASGKGEAAEKVSGRGEAAGKAAEKAARKGKAAGKSKAVEKAIEKAVGKAAEEGKATEEAAGKRKAVGKAAEKASGKGEAAEKASGRGEASGKAAEKAAGKGKAVEKAAEKGEAAGNGKGEAVEKGETAEKKQNSKIYLRRNDSASVWKAYAKSQSDLMSERRAKYDEAITCLEGALAKSEDVRQLLAVATTKIEASCQRLEARLAILKEKRSDLDEGS